MNYEGRKLLHSLTLLDRFLFAEVMEDASAYRAVLEIILERDIHLKEDVQSEKEIRTLPNFRGIRLDVWGMNEDGTIYNSEMQKKDTKNLPKRSRFYQSVMDAGLLEVGETDFNQLNDIWLITIMPFDLFGLGKFRYTFRMRCDEENSLELKDGAVRMFLNTRGQNREEISDELYAFLKYAENPTDEMAAAFESEKIKKLHERVTKVKRNEENEVKYMQLWEELVMERNEGRIEGRSEGRSEGREEGIHEGLDMKAQIVARNMFMRGMSQEDTAVICGESLEKISGWFEEWGRMK